MKAERTAGKWEPAAENPMPLDGIYDQNGELVAGATADSQDDVKLLTGAEICTAVNNLEQLVAALRVIESYENNCPCSECEDISYCAETAREALTQLEESNE